MSDKRLLTDEDFSEYFPALDQRIRDHIAALNDQIRSLKGERARLITTLDDMQEENNPVEIERSRNADRFAREGF